MKAFTCMPISEFHKVGRAGVGAVDFVTSSNACFHAILPVPLPLTENFAITISPPARVEFGRATNETRGTALYMYMALPAAVPLTVPAPVAAEVPAELRAEIVEIVVVKVSSVVPALTPTGANANSTSILFVVPALTRISKPLQVRSAAAAADGFAAPIATPVS